MHWIFSFLLYWAVAERLQKVEEYRRLLKSLLPLITRFMLCLIFGSCILPRTPVGPVRCSRCPMDGNWSSEQPQAQIQKLWVRVCCCHGWHHLSTMWVPAVGHMHWGPHRLHQPLLFRQHIPVLDKRCSDCKKTPSEGRETKLSDVPWAIWTLWVALWCSGDKGSVQPRVFWK